MRRRVVLALALGAATAGCAALLPRDEVQRTTEGPTAEDMLTARFLDGFKRPPTFDEGLAFRAEMEQRIADYLARHPEMAASPRASQLRFARRVSVGMNRSEVVLLVGEPLAATGDRAAMQRAAGPFWLAIGGEVQEMWSYPGGWKLYWNGDRLADLTYVGKPPQ